MSTSRSFTQQGHFYIEVPPKRMFGGIYGGSPWGQVDCVEVIADGMIRVSTPSHGGIGISHKRYSSMHPAYQIHGSCKLCQNLQWIFFEEDSEVALVFESFFDEVNAWRKGQGIEALQKEYVNRAVANYYPEAFEARFERQLQAGESATRDRENFYTKHALDLIAVAAFSGEKNGVPGGMVGVKATYGGHRGGKEFCFLVPVDEYQQRIFGFVVDPSRHPVWLDGIIGNSMRSA